MEEMLIAWVSPIMYVYRKQGGQRGYKGHILNLSRNIQTLFDTLPPSVTDIPILVLRRTGANATHSNFTVHRQKVLDDTLPWLQQNNPFYKSIIIDHNIIQQLPENGVPQEIFNNTYTNTVQTHSDVADSDTDTECTNDDMETNNDSDLSNNDTDIDFSGSAMMGVSSVQLPSYLDEFMWREQWGRNKKEAYTNLMADIASQYPV